MDWHKFRERMRGVQFRFWCWTRLSMLKKVFHFSAGRFTSKNRGISLITNVIYSGCCQCVLYLYAKCFISSTSAIELNTKNKLAAPPKFMFFAAIITWSFGNLLPWFLWEQKATSFLTVRGVRLRKEEKKEVKGEVGYSHKKLFYSGTSFDKEYWAFSFAFGVELD